jgi:hypothetical protein
LAIHEVEIPAAAGYAVTDSFSLGGPRSLWRSERIDPTRASSLRQGELSHLGDAAPEEVSASCEVTHVALVDFI